jgi:sulfite exporter TauE/SafE
MSAMVAALFLASVLGSLHCAGMCGAFVALAIGSARQGWRISARLQVAYHLGRLVTYTLLGAAAGTAGSLLDLAGALAGLKPLAAVLAGASMVVFGVMAFLRARGCQLSLGRLRLPQAWTRLVQRGHRAAFDRPPLMRAALIGLLTTLLPCGWLYAFAIVAAGTGSAARGALAMSAFWAGTLPALVSLGAGLHNLLGPLKRSVPALTSIALVAVGLYTLAGRWMLDPAVMASPPAAHQAVFPSPRNSHACCEAYDAGD